MIPTTPNSTLHQQQNQLNEQLLQQNQQLLSMQRGHGKVAAVNTTNNNNHSTAINSDSSSSTANVEERLSQIQDYIRITTSLIETINAEKVRICFFM